MTEAGILDESAYYESLHETPLIANTIARKKLHEMNVVISDTAEYGNYIFSEACVPLLEEFMLGVQTDVIGTGLVNKSNKVDNSQLVFVNAELREHDVEIIGEELREYMESMKAID